MCLSFFCSHMYTTPPMGALMGAYIGAIMKNIITVELTAWLKSFQRARELGISEPVERRVRGRPASYPLGLARGPRPTEAELLKKEHDAFIQDTLERNQGQARLWNMGVFHMSPTERMAQSKERPLLHGSGLPDSHERPNLYWKDELELQTRVPVHPKGDDAGFKWTPDKEPTDDTGDDSPWLNVTGSMGRTLSKVKPREKVGFVKPGQVTAELDKKLARARARVWAQHKPKMRALHVPDYVPEHERLEYVKKRYF